MVAIVKTQTPLNANYSANDSRILVYRKKDATKLIVSPTTDLSKLDRVKWVKYQIKETDMRVKTATFTTNQYLDLTTGQYGVMIISPLHEDFGGIILDVDYDKKTGLYSYKCQDHSRNYQSKVDLVVSKSNVYKVLRYLITRGGISLKSEPSKAALNKYKSVLSGLRPAYQYYQYAYGSITEYNPMLDTIKMIIRNKSYIEVIRDLIYGSGAYIDVYFDKYGILHIEPYHKDDLYNTGLFLSNAELSSASMKFDTTNIITGAKIQSSNQLKSGSIVSSSSLVNLDLTAFFGVLNESVDNPDAASNNSGKSSGKSDKKDTSKTKTSNPYKTKNKTIWLSSDNIHGKTTDTKFLKDIAKILKKNGWKTKIVGVGPNYHTEKYMGPKKGIWFCVYGGADGATYKEACGKNSYTNKLKKLGSRTVIGMRGGGDIRKGGKYYKWLPRAHDDNYSPSGFRGVKYPLKMLTKAKVPIMYASTPEKMVAKFLKGGDNPEAC